MTLAPVRQAGDVCPSPAIQPCPASVLVIRTRASVRYALQTLGIRATREEVDDLIQETLLRLWTRYPKRWCRYPRRLVNRVALRILVDRLRFATAKKRDTRKAVSLESAGAVSLDTSEPDDVLIAREELEERFQSCRAALPREQLADLRRALRLGPHEPAGGRLVRLQAFHPRCAVLPHQEGARPSRDRSPSPQERRPVVTVAATAAPSCPPGDRFRLGRLVMTRGAERAIDEASDDPFVFLSRHASGDWGEVCDEDQAANERAVDHGLRILSAYRTGKGERLWVITEADRSATTILLPEEY